MFWESTVVGRVVSKGSFIPVKDVLVEWSVVLDEGRGDTTSIGGVLLSDGSGDFEIHIQDTDFELYVCAGPHGLASNPHHVVLPPCGFVGCVVLWPWSSCPLPARVDLCCVHRRSAFHV